MRKNVETTAIDDYITLFEHSKRARLLQSIANLLEWDQETYMPVKSSAFRSQQLELMAGLIHKEKTSPSFVKSLQKLIDLKTGHVLAKGLTADQQAALREWRHDYLIASALPNAFVKSFAKLTCESMVVWANARKENSFSTFSPYLEKIVAAAKQQAEYIGYKKHPYDALLGLFEPEITTEIVTEVFAKLKKGIKELLAKIQSAPQVDDACLYGKFPQEKQLQFAHSILKQMGYNMEHGRLDLSTHPFSMSLHPSDSRITTRIHSNSLFDCISTVLHEGGHSLYEMGLLPEYYGSPLCEAVSLGVHESQSRLWETRIGQSKAFWKHFLPSLKKTFPQLENTNLEVFYKAINKVAPTFIRVESDEVTYSLHVIVRFELEKQLIEGSLKVRDLPAAWNEKMKDLLGITPPTDREGCLQDVHWSMGAFGYFPTYALGNLYASQFFEAFVLDFPDWEKRVAAGELLFLKNWLGEKIHKHGRTYRANDLIKKVTGHKISEKPYLSYLNQKYKVIYNLT